MLTKLGRGIQRLLGKHRHAEGDGLTLTPDLPRALFQQVLQEWEREKPSLMKTTHLGAQELITPYIVSRPMHGHWTHVLIGSIEGQAWYDRPMFAPFEYDIATQLGLIHQGATIFDVGANQGVLTTLMAQSVGSFGQIHAFDPFPVNAALCRHNARLNALSQRVFVYQFGASDQTKNVKASLRQQIVAVCDEYDPIEIALVPLDDYAHLKPTLIKLDVEGAEFHALLGMKKILSTLPNLMIEVHPDFLPHFGKTSRDVFELLPLKDYPTKWVYAHNSGLQAFRSIDELKPDQHCHLFLSCHESFHRTYQPTVKNTN